MENATTAIPKRRWFSVLALSAAAFVDSSENYALSVLWPRMYPALGLRVGQLGPVLGISDLIRTITLPLWAWAADRFSRKALLESRFPNHGRVALALTGLALTAPSLAGFIAFGDRGLGMLMLFGMLSGPTRATALPCTRC